MTVTLPKLRGLVRVLIAFIAFGGCTTDGGPGTESPLPMGGAGNSGDDGGVDASGTGGAAGTAGAGAGAGGSGGVAGSVAGGMGGAGGVGGLAGVGGTGGAAGEPLDSDAGVTDEGFCTVEASPKRAA